MTSGEFPWPNLALDSAVLKVSSPQFAGGEPWAGHAGWVQFAGHLLCGDVLERGPGSVPLGGEWTDADGAMHRLHTAIAGDLIHVTVIEGLSGEAFGAQTITVFGGVPAGLRRLTYRIFWREGNDGSLDRAFDMFAGFDKGRV